MAASHSPAQSSAEAAASAARGFAERGQAATQAAELEVDLARARRLARLGAPIWASFALYDLLQASRPEVGHLWELLMLRALGTVLLIAFGLWARNMAKPVRMRIDVGMTISGMTLSFLVSLMSLYDGGFASVYSPGIVLVMFAMAIVPRPVRRGLRINTLVILPYPAVLCAAVALSPRHAALLREPGVIAAAVQFHFTVLATSTFAALLGHALWSTRRELLAQQSLGRYQLFRPLGNGPWGEVWAGYHHGLGREVAIKLFHASPHDAETGARLQHALRSFSALTHTNSVRVYDFGISEDGRPYYAMELLQGETLRGLVERDGKLGVERAARLILQAARAVAEAHGRGLVHGNLKPENVFVTASGDQPDVVKVLDFGLSALAAPGHELSATPEADVYALGALFFFLLTAEPVLKGESAVREHERVPSPSARRGLALPDRIESLVVRCLESDPAERFGNARELANALEACLARLDSSALALAQRPAALSRARKLPSNHERMEGEQTRVEDQEIVAQLLRAAEDAETVVSR